MISRRTIFGFALGLLPPQQARAEPQFIAQWLDMPADDLMRAVKARMLFPLGKIEADLKECHGPFRGNP